MQPGVQSEEDRGRRQGASLAAAGVTPQGAHAAEGGHALGGPRKREKRPRGQGSLAFAVREPSHHPYLKLQAQPAGEERRQRGNGDSERASHFPGVTQPNTLHAQALAGGGAEPHPHQRWVLGWVT